ncbi:MAG: hypothetical protein R3C19_27400 [Planctomycetaceae bacterium]
MVWGRLSRKADLDHDPGSSDLRLDIGHVLGNPFGEWKPSEFTCSKSKDNRFGIVYVSIQFISVQYEERLHRCMTDPFIAVDEWMIHHQRKTQGRGLLCERCVQVFAAKGHLGLRECRFSQSQVTNPAGTT